MKAAWITDAYRLEIRQMPIPELGPEDVLIRPARVGICGSDMTLYKGEHPFRRPPMIPGHEMVGTIAALGSAVTGVRVGERVAVNHTIPCGKCRYCRAGHPNICPEKTYAGGPAIMGFFADYVKVPQATLFPIRDGVSDDCAAIAEPLSIAEHLIHRLEVIPDDTPRSDRSIAIIGAGTIGLLALIVAKQRGYGHIYCMDPLPGNRLVAEQLGAEATFADSGAETAKEILRRNGGHGVTAAVVSVAVPEIIDQACALTDTYGTILMAPMSQKVIPFNIYSLVAREQHIIGCRGILREDFGDAVALINSGFDFSPMITHVLPFSELQRGFDLMLNRPAGETVIKVLVRPDSEKEVH